MKSRDAIIGIDRAYSQRDEIRAKSQNLTERPAIHCSTYERVDLTPNRNERQIRPDGKNRADRWTVYRYSQANTPFILHPMAVRLDD